MDVVGTGPVDKAERNRLYRKIALRILPILFISYIVANLERHNVGIAKLGFMKDLGFTNFDYGVGAGIFYLGYCIFEIPSNMLIARFGFRTTLIRIMLLWGVCSAGLALMTSPLGFFIGRFLLGIAEAGFFPGVLFYLTLWVPKSRRSLFTAVFMSALSVSGIIGGPLGGLIMHHMDGVYGLENWQWLFILEALPTAILAVVVYFTLSNGPDSAPWLNERERAILRQDLGSPAPGAPAEHGSPLVALRQKRFYMMAAMAFALVSGLGGLGLWTPTVIRDSGVSNIAVVGAMTAIPFVVGLIAQFSNAWHSDKTQERRWHAALSALFAAAGWLLLPFAAGSPALSIGALVIIAAGSFGATAPFWTIPALMLTGKSAAVAIATVSTFGSIGGLVSPSIVGLITDRSGSLSLGLCYYGAMMTFGAIVLIIGTRSMASGAHSGGEADSAKPAIVGAGPST
jgi:MFS family permease